MLQVVPLVHFVSECIFCAIFSHFDTFMSAKLHIFLISLFIGSVILMKELMLRSGFTLDVDEVCGLLQCSIGSCNVDQFLESLK